jgi:decaprenyl-phosphate phosphoribosyltransferase
VALSLAPAAFSILTLWRCVLGLFAVGLVASSNYVLNELLDAPFDRAHPSKRSRPIPSGRVNIPLAYVQWLAFAAAGLFVAFMISAALAGTLTALLIMGLIYNVPPIRTKDLPIVDVVSEAVNNPLRMIAGWYMVGPLAVPPTSALLSYWMIGCYFMALKRYAEYRQIKNPDVAATYRRSFRLYTPQRLLVSVQFYGSAAMLFFGAFIMRYRLELILSFPLVALVMAAYMRMAFKPDSAAQTPERLHKESLLMATTFFCAFSMIVLLFCDIPLLHQIFAPTVISSP